MGSDDQFPNSLPSSKVRDPSFSLYLNEAADDQAVVKLAELTRSRSGQSGRISTDREISVFSADKYFNEDMELDNNNQKHQKHEEIPEGVDAVVHPVRSKISLGTPSIRSESSWHSQSALLHSSSAQVSGRRSTGEIQRIKSLLSSISCRCSCASKKSIKVDDNYSKSVASKESITPGNSRADQLLKFSATLPRKSWTKDSMMMLHPSAKPSLVDKASASPISSIIEKKHSPKLQQCVISDTSYTRNSFDLPARKKIEKSMSSGRMENRLNWEDSNTSIYEDVCIPSAISVEYYTDAESDASSDLFEIDSFTGQRKPSFSGQIPDSTASGYETPTTGYAASEASVDWSVITASGADFSTLSDCQEFKFKPAMPVINTQNSRNTVNVKYRRNNENAGPSLISFENQKEVGVIGNMDLQKTKENVTCHQKMAMDQFVPFSRHQMQASICPPATASTSSHSNRQSEN